MKWKSLALCVSASLPLSLAAPAAPLPPSLTRHGAVDVVLRGQGPRAVPRLLLGPLSARSPGAAPRAVAERFLAGLRAEAPALVPGELTVAEVVPVGSGHVVRVLQRHRGLPVLGGELVLRVAEDGQVTRLVRDVVEGPLLLGLDVAPRLQADEARARARALHGATPGEPTLQIDGESGRLAWVVPSNDLRRLENALYLVDAHTGEVLRRIERLSFADQFRVFRPNPAVSNMSELAPVPGGAGSPFSPDPGTPRVLSSKLLKSINCIDDATTRQIMGFEAHLCAPQQLAAADVDDNYDSLDPLVGPADGKCPTTKDANQNQFAEAHMYWHAASIYDRFRKLYAGLNRPDFKLRVSQNMGGRPLPMVVNLCIPDFADLANPNKPLQPFENAFFSPGGQGGLNEILTGQDTDAIGFGMGTRSNFALDGDVIYHEFTHAVVWTRQKLLLATFEDEWGPNTDPGAMNEGVADFFSSGLAGDPQVGEYAWRNFSNMGGGLRNLDNKEQCADHRLGEMHEDSKAFSGALWQARRAIAGDPREGGGPAAAKRDVFDQAVLAALDGSGARPTMTDMAKLLVQELGMRAQQLGQDAGTRMEQALTDHGLLPLCNRVISKPAVKPALCLDGTETRGGRKLMAGHVQWRIEVPPTADTLTVKLGTEQGSCSGGGAFGMSPPAAKLKLAVRHGDEPLTWDRDEGTQDELIDLTASGRSWQGTVKLEKGVHHVMIVNGGGSTIGRNITLLLSCEDPAGCKAPEMPMPMDEKPLKDAGCGCRVGAAEGLPGLPAAGLVLGLLALLRRRRAR